MKKAYMIMAHDSPEKVNRLVRVLNYNSDFFIHIDKKSDIELFKRKLCDLENVHFCETRVTVNWAGWNQLQAILIMMNDAVKYDKSYSHLILMTETDYPIWSNQEIETYLRGHMETQFIMAYNCTRSPVKTDRNRINHVWWYDWPQWTPFLHKWIRRIFNRTIFSCIRKRATCLLSGKRVDVYFGQMLFAVTPKCAEFILRVYNTDKRFNRYMKTTFAPCELYYHTILFNSKFRTQTIDGGEEHEITPDFSWAPLHHYNYANTPKVYEEGDYDELINCGKPFFRKAIIGVSDSLMNKIDIKRSEYE